MRSRSCTSRARSSTSAGHARGRAPGLDGRGDHRPDRGLRAGRGVAARTGSSRRRAAGRRRRRRPPPRAPPTPAPRPRRSDRDLPRAARRRARAAVGTVLCLGLDPDPARAARPASRATSPASSGSRRCSLEAAAPYAAAVKPNLAFFEAFGSAGMAALERLRARDPGRPPGRRRRQARRHRLDRGAPGGRAVRRPRRRRGDRQPVPRAPRRIAPLLERAGPVRLRPVPDVEPGRGRAPGPGRRGGPGDRRARPSRSTCGSPGVRDGWGPGGTVGLVVGATAPAELRGDPGDRARPAVPRARASAPRAATIEPVLARRPGDGRAGRRGDRAAACWSTCRGHRRRRPRRARRRAVRATPASVSRRPPADWAARLPVLP